MMPEAKVDIFLTADEVAELDKQDPTTAPDGGFQGLIVNLAQRVARDTGHLQLSDRDLQRIGAYAFAYGNGSWENWLLRAFRRTLGPKLDGNA